MNDQWQKRVAAAIARICKHHWVFPASVYLEIIDDIVDEKLTAKQITNKHGGSPVQTALSHVTMAIYLKGKRPRLSDGGYCDLQDGRYVVAPAFAAAWKLARG